jgi:predicted flap endonuclease-1-like 5' DNA nuclease
MTIAQNATPIPIAYIEACVMMLGAFVIGYAGCYLFLNKKLKKQHKESVEKDQSLHKRIKELNEEIDHLERIKSYQKDRMDQDYESVKFNVKAFSEKIIDDSMESPSASALNFDILGYATEEEKDNLQQIHGIGPYTEEKLNKLGIYTFEQISKFTEADILNVTELIKFFPDRIKNDQWVSKARDMISKQSNEKPLGDQSKDEKSIYAKTTS